MVSDTTRPAWANGCVRAAKSLMKKASNKDATKGAAPQGETKGAFIGADVTRCLSCGETLLCNRDAEPLCARCYDLLNPTPDELQRRAEARGMEVFTCAQCGAAKIASDDTLELIKNAQGETLCDQCRKAAPCQAIADALANADELPISADAAALLKMQPDDFFVRERVGSVSRLIVMRPVKLGAPALQKSRFKIAVIEVDGELCFIEGRDGQLPTMPVRAQIVAVAVSIAESVES